MSGQIRRELRPDGVALLTLDNPAHRNALNNPMIAALTTAFQEWGQDPQARVILLRGAGGIFCAGRELGDLVALQSAGMDAINGAYDRLRVLNEAVYYCPKPVVTLLERYALGAGILLAGWSDIALAEADCLIGYPEVKLGIPPTQTTISLIRGISRKAAVELVLTARNIRAEEAARIGLITRAVPAGQLQAEADAVVAALLGNSPDAIARTKQLIWKTEDADHRAALSVGVDTISVAVATRAAQEGVAAFLARRAPQW